ncbi:MAG: DUF72 domain-containing protein [Patescibacteria group bacterium]|nr:DUF72 domain-containing protein [Patescibacteria group bacterium]
MKKNNKILIGTSGWNYFHWRRIFYPVNLNSQELLSYYAQHLSTVEINSSFYHLPQEKTFLHWREKVPKNFLFSVKVWRRITHLKKLNQTEDDLKTFWQRSLVLKEKLGPLLFQFPPSFKLNQIRFKKFCQFLRKLVGKNQKASFEFRNESWFSSEVYKILRKYNFALCWADAPCYPYKEVVTADYLYLRLHGHEQLYASKYTKRQLEAYAKKIKEFFKKGKMIYVYFDNDAYGYAIENALELKKLLKK